MQNNSWLILGGKDSSGVPTSTTDMLEIDMFQQNLPWPEVVSGHCMVKVNHSHLFVAGGEGEGKRLLATAYLIDIEQSHWVPIEQDLAHERSGHVCGLAMDEEAEKHIVIAGGIVLLDVEMLNLATMRWRPGPALPHEMNWAASIQIGHRMYISGGEHIGYCSKSHLCFSSEDIYEINLEQSVWKAHEQTMKLPRSNHILLFIHDNLDLCQDSCLGCNGNIDPRWMSKL